MPARQLPGSASDVRSAQALPAARSDRLGIAELVDQLPELTSAGVQHA